MGTKEEREETFPHKRFLRERHLWGGRRKEEKDIHRLKDELMLPHLTVADSNLVSFNTSSKHSQMANCFNREMGGNKGECESRYSC